MSMRCSRCQEAGNARIFGSGIRLVDHGGGHSTSRVELRTHPGRGLRWEAESPGQSRFHHQAASGRIPEEVQPGESQCTEFTSELAS